MAFFCNPITGNAYRRACTLTKGGLINIVYGANLSEVDTVTVSGGIVTNITMKTNPISSTPYHWYAITPKKQTSGINNVAQIGTNTKFYNQELDFAIVGMDTENKNSFQSLINGQAVFIGQDANQVRHMMGHVSGAEMTEGAIGTGIAVDDLVGGTAKFVAQETFVTPTVQAGLVINVLSNDGITIEAITL
jgi:hypothetical protein